MKNLVIAIAVVEKLLDYKLGSSKGQEGDDGHAERNIKKSQRNKAKASEKQGKTKAKNFGAPKEKQMSKSISCFVCGGNHYGKEFPLKHQCNREVSATVGWCATSLESCCSRGDRELRARPNGPQLRLSCVEREHGDGDGGQWGDSQFHER